MDVLLFGMFYLIFGTVTGLIGGFVWQSRGAEFTDGFWMGLFLNLIGVFIAAIARPVRPWNAEDGPMRPALN